MVTTTNDCFGDDVDNEIDCDCDDCDNEKYDAIKGGGYENEGERASF